MNLIFDKCRRGARGVNPPPCDVPDEPAIPDSLRRAEDAHLCELSEPEIARHFHELSTRNFGVDSGFYPLGSCTMKYNAKVLEAIARRPGFAGLHPLLAKVAGGGPYAQGALEVLASLEERLCEITGMGAYTLQPLAGAHGELTGMLLVAAYHHARGDAKRTEVLIPDESHGTNPSSAATAGLEVVSIPTDPSTGMLDLAALKQHLSERTAAVMLTNPNTLGIFHAHIREVVACAHEQGALVYYDGANLNAVLGRFRPGDAGIDVVHVNLHKTFGTPHGGGGPGAGPVGVNGRLEPFLPGPRPVRCGDGQIRLEDAGGKSIGPVAPFYGQFGVCLKALAYIELLGGDGLRAVSEAAVLNANYLRQALKDDYELPFDHPCMHEFVLSASRQAANGVHATDIAKGLIEAGIHPPTVYFPLIVEEAMMFEPTETENRPTLDRFIDVMRALARRAKEDPGSLQAAPRNTAVCRPDETGAARRPDLCSA
ncbi:aminomethyl-transferring glycine dehydrogenase subunit GcvPB [Kiritimatiella glycovorans]|uniref:glycine dehydrogenase (aminomethyl-transferring) n=1 Tax=Kiritimatiella glycovorans TaxID=1307763 RepID=A0A0G3EM66_9BACT|nr:aminomethyl-transferring glycine dehydrogenase subunit GcvPB [Kiritimatiella glycovorans]AKJ65254.1 putative glycine dehydrogenase [decarboxylating] subunit 2 [Kiritimatiella glycovorans]